MSRFRSLVDTPKRLAIFRANYGIPNDVKVSYCPDDYVDFRRRIETVIIPLFAFIEGGGGTCPSDSVKIKNKKAL